MLKKITRPLLIIFLLVVIFIVLVVIFVNSDEEGNIKISLLSFERKINDNGFNDLINQEINIANLSDIDWSKTYEKALKAKYQSDISAPVNSSRIPVSTGAKNKDDKIRKRFIKYLEASNVRFNEKENPLKLAIQYRNQGQTQKIDELIFQMADKIALVETITPPEEVVGYHLVKLRLLRETKEILGEIKKSKNESLEEIITEKEFEHLSRLSLILKEYLTYFFLNKN